MRSQRTRARPRGKGFIRRDRGDIPESREGAHEGNATRRAAKGTKCRNTAFVVEAAGPMVMLAALVRDVAVEET
ncbi:hypothetical protein ERJ75_001144300 [Trypanosoma vivax]|nr:hypothetical protein ERJ75_001144300 [Trypanosoma vivax]